MRLSPGGYRLFERLARDLAKRSGFAPDLFLAACQGSEPMPEPIALWLQAEYGIPVDAWEVDTGTGKHARTLQTKRRMEPIATPEKPRRGRKAAKSDAVTRIGLATIARALDVDRRTVACWHNGSRGIPASKAALAAERFPSLTTDSRTWPRIRSGE